MATSRRLGALAVVVALTLASCGGGSGSDGAEPSGTSGADGASSTAVETTAGTTAPVAVPAGDLDVRVVADSEVPDAVSELLDQQPGITVTSMRSMKGATMAELDASADEALAQAPDVLVYSGGANDLPDGPAAILSGLKDRLTRYQQDACVVMAVPIFRYQRGTEAEVQQRTAGTRVLEQAAASTGARVASYLDVSLAMDREGQDFFAEGELGDLHPGSQSYPRLAEAIAEQVRACA